MYPATLSRDYSINRLTGEVSLTTVYLYNEEDVDPQYSYSVFAEKRCELSESPDDTTITISGSFKGNAVDGDDEMEQIRYRYEQTDWQALAQIEWENWGGTTTLGENIQFSVDENPLTAEMSFSLTWSVNSKQGAYIQENWSVIRSYQGEPTCFRYQGTVRNDHGCIGQRFDAVENLFDSTNFAARAAGLWNKYGTGETLSPVARSQSKTVNRFSGTISFEITYCHDPSQGCGCAENMTYSLDFVESIEQYSSQPILRGLGRYATQDLGIKNRKKFTIQGSARRSKCCTVEQAKSNLKTRLNFLCAMYFNESDRILENAQMDSSDSGDNLNFNYSWSAAA